MVRYCTCHRQILIDSFNPNNVSTWNLRRKFNICSCCKNNSLNIFFKQVFLLSWFVIWSHNSNFLSCSNSSWENSSESKESSSVCCWYHLRDVHKEGSLWVAFSHWLGNWVNLWSFIKIGGSVFLSSSWWW